MPRHPKKSERRADVPADKTELPLWIVCAIRGAWAEGIATVRAKDAGEPWQPSSNSKRSRIRSISSGWPLDRARRARRAGPCYDSPTRDTPEPSYGEPTFPYRQKRRRIVATVYVLLFVGSAAAAGAAASELVAQFVGAWQ